MMDYIRNFTDTILSNLNSLGVSKPSYDIEVYKSYELEVSNNDVNSFSNKSQKDLISPVAKGDNTGIDIVAILVSVSVAVAVIVTIVLIACILCIKSRRKSKKKQLIMKYDKMFTMPRRPSPFAVVSAQMQLNERPEQRSVYNALDLVTDRPQFKDIELSDFDSRSERSSKSEKLTKYHSFETTSTCPKPPKLLKKSKSATSLLTSALTEPEQSATISFSLKYAPALRQLLLKLHGASDLPVKTYGFEVYATVYLFPSKPDGVKSKTMPGGPNVRFEETFLFDDMNMSEIEKSTLRLVLHSRRKTKGNKECFLGEYIVKCCDVDLIPDQPKEFESHALRSREKSGSTCEKYLFEDLGSLFVCIEYQPVANRLKVMVRKSSNLPKSDKLIGRPGHYVIINLVKDREIVKSQETRTQSGYKPIWNQPFLFDLAGSCVDNYYLDFIVMRGKIHTKDGIVGHVTIGPNCGKTGRSHWKDIMSPRPLETAKWHSILPMFNFKPSFSLE